METNQFRKFQTIKSKLKGPALKKSSLCWQIVQMQETKLWKHWTSPTLTPKNHPSPRIPALEVAINADGDAGSIKQFVNNVGMIIECLKAYDRSPLGDRFFMGSLKRKTPDSMWVDWMNYCDIKDCDRDNPEVFLDFCRKKSTL